MLFAGQLHPCYRPFDKLDLRGCAAAEFGLLRGAGYGTLQDSARTVSWAALGLRIEGGLALTRVVGLETAIDALWALTRPEFVLDNVGFVYQPSPVSLRVGIGVVAHFP
jgi:hypothetical protein